MLTFDDALSMTLHLKQRYMWGFLCVSTSILVWIYSMQQCITLSYWESKLCSVNIVFCRSLQKKTHLQYPIARGSPCSRPPPRSRWSCRTLSARNPVPSRFNHQSYKFFEMPLTARLTLIKISFCVLSERCCWCRRWACRSFRPPRLRLSHTWWTLQCSSFTNSCLLCFLSNLV